MKSALAALQRIRRGRKSGARLDLAGAERARVEQEARVEEICEQVARSRSGDELGYAGGEAIWLAQEQAWRLRREMDLRRERSELEARLRVVEGCRDVLAVASREARVVDLALERIDEAEAVDRRRADGRRIDSVAAERWWMTRGEADDEER